MVIDIPQLISLYTSRKSILAISKQLFISQRRLRRTVKYLISNGTLEKRTIRSASLKPKIIDLYKEGNSINMICQKIEYHNAKEITRVLTDSGFQVGKKKWDTNLDASLKRDYLNLDMLFRDIVKKYQPYSSHKIISILKDLKLLGLRKTKSTRKITNDILEEMIYLYDKMKIGSCTLADKYKIPQGVVRRILKKSGVMRKHTPRQPLAAAITPNELDINRKIVYKYLMEKKTIMDIAKEFNMSRNTISNRLKHLGVKTRDRKGIWQSKIESGKFQRKVKSSEIVNMYSYDKMSMSDITKILKIGNNCVEKVLKHYGVGRTYEESRELSKRKNINIRNHKVFENIHADNIVSKDNISLNEEQRNLIIDNYEECKDVISRKMANNSITKHLQRNQNLKLHEIVNMVITFLPEVALRYKSDKISFPLYAAYKSVLLFIDHLRVIMDYPRLVMERWKAVEKIKGEIKNKQGYADESDIIKELENKNIKGDKLKKYMDSYKMFGGIKNLSDLSICNDDSEFDRMDRFLIDNRKPHLSTDWIDLKDEIINKIEFMNLGFTGDTQSHARAIIVENILPSCDNSQFITLKNLGKRFKLSESRISQMKTSILANPSFQYLIKSHLL